MRYIPFALYVGAFIIAAPSQAAYLLSIRQTSTNVTATGDGSLNLSDLAFISGIFADRAVIEPSNGHLSVGPAASTFDDAYTGISGPALFGPGSYKAADFGLGSLVGIVGALGRIIVPDGYVSGATLGESISVWNNASLDSLGLVGGTYVYGWGSGANVDSFTVQIGPATVPPTIGVPELATWLLFVGGFGLVGGIMRHRRDRAEPCEFERPGGLSR